PKRAFPWSAINRLGNVVRLVFVVDDAIVIEAALGGIAIGQSLIPFRNRLVGPGLRRVQLVLIIILTGLISRLDIGRRRGGHDRDGRHHGRVRGIVVVPVIVRQRERGRRAHGENRNSG